MTLSSNERHALQQIEADLAVDDPHLAARFTANGRRRHFALRNALLALSGLLLLLAGMCFKDAVGTTVAVTGYALVVFAVCQAFRASTPECRLPARWLRRW